MNELWGEERDSALLLHIADFKVQYAASLFISGLSFLMNQRQLDRTRMWRNQRHGTLIRFYFPRYD